MKSSKILETIQDPWTGVKKWFADAQKCGLNNYNAVTLFLIGKEKFFQE